MNPVKAKSLTNHRSATKGITVGLSPAIKMSLERAIEYIANDELARGNAKSPATS